MFENQVSCSNVVSDYGMGEKINVNELLENLTWRMARALEVYDIIFFKLALIH